MYVSKNYPYKLNTKDLKKKVQELQEKLSSERIDSQWGSVVNLTSVIQLGVTELSNRSAKWCARVTLILVFVSTIVAVTALLRAGC